MSTGIPLANEARRLETLRRYSIMDTLPEQALDDLSALAAQICDTPVAFISFVDGERQWFKSKVGSELKETPREISFCSYAIQQDGIFIVPDARLDERFSRSPLVTGQAGIRFYAGVPLISSEGEALGALCVNDKVPRNLKPAQEHALKVLARQVMAHLELRRHTNELIKSEDRLKTVTSNSRVGLVMVDRERKYTYANETYSEILNLSSHEIIGRQVAEVLPGIYEDHIRPRLDRAFQGERVSYELAKASEGIDRYYSVRYEPSRVDGEVTQVVVVLADITERREDEMASKRLAAIVEFSDDAIIGKDLNSIITSWNKGAEKVFGYSAREMTGESIMKLIPPERHDEEEYLLSQIRAGQSVEHFETVRKKKDGTLINVSVTVSPIKDSEGNVVGISKVARDVTERKLADERLVLLNTCVSNLNDIVLITESEPVDEPGPRILFVNEAFEQITGYASEEALGKSPRFLQGEKTDRKTLDQIRQALVDQKPIRREVINYRKDGSEYWLDIDMVPVLNAEGKCSHFVSIERDITAQKKAGEQIAEQAAFLNKARDAILVRDLEGNILFWNQGAERIYGWMAGEVLGKNIGNILYPDPKKFGELNEITKTVGEWNGEIQHLTRDKQLLTIEARWTLIRDNDGKAKSILAINTDITEKKKIEAQFLRAQRMESIGTLAGGIAHDLNNILAPIMMSIDILKTTTDHPMAKKTLEAIEISSKRGADIVRQVLSFARGMEGERVEVQPKHLLKDIENIIQDTFPKDIRLDFDVPNGIWTILGDPTQMHQILLNLCVNARDAMPNGGRLSLCLENTELDEHYAAMNLQARPGRYVVISITDSGTGIPQDVIEKIFEPFFTTKELHKGTGLGLSTVMAIVKSHGGIINVYSETGKGTTFKVYLPAIDSSQNAQMVAPIEASLPRGNGEIILVVDDEASILTITGQTLEAFGYRTLTAMDGAEAVAVYAQRGKDVAVVLTDMRMPVMDGPATIHALMRINPQVKIIAASGLNANGGVAKVSGAGVRHFLMKPYTAGTLLKTMRSILEEK